MDVSTADHSDSDSGESWTLLEHMTTDGNITVSQENELTQQSELALNVEKDEDTDGISIISDSDHESSTPCELSYDYTKCLEETLPPKEHTPQYISISALKPNNSNHHESMKDEDILGDRNGKHKTYVHRRNRRLSMVLNIIMLGSVITAAGVAIGHMWGAKNDCSLHTTPSVNKILSNLYKLQEENAYLRSKLKELTYANMQMNHKQVSTEKSSQNNKQQRCKKVYEGSINNRNEDKATKCLDSNVELILNAPTIQHEYEKDFLHDVDKLKHVYQQNKSWLDEEVSKRMKREIHSSESLSNIFKKVNLNTVEEEPIESKDLTIKGQAENIESENELVQNPFQESDSNKTKEIKVSYADSLKSDHREKEMEENILKAFDRGIKELNTKKTRKGDSGDITPQIFISDHELKKDDRYIAPKTKQDRKKHDRQNIRKKQKRKNKYEQWEMKGGYLKDYDEFSISSSQDNEYGLRKPNRNILNHFDDLNDFEAKYNDKNLKKLTTNDIVKEKHLKNKNKDSNWYDKRTTSRSEARRKLEQELFEKTTPNNARWYFRRMQKREQCRAKGDNSTHKKQTKRHMNYKMKR